MAATGQPAALADLETLHHVAQQLRVDGIRASTRAGSGHPTSSLSAADLIPVLAGRVASPRAGSAHPTSSMSAADLIAVLAGRHLRYDFAPPKLPTNDHLIFSKGHASPLLRSDEHTSEL